MTERYPAPLLRCCWLFMLDDCKTALLNKTRLPVIATKSQCTKHDLEHFRSSEQPGDDGTNMEGKCAEDYNK